MRSSITLCVLVATAAVPFALSPIASAQSSNSAFSHAHAEHLLNRAGFGGPPSQVKALAAMGKKNAVEALFNPAADGASAPDFVVKTIPRPDIRKLREMDEMERRKQRNLFRRADRTQMQAFREWWMERMVQSPDVLREKMVLFWHGYFTSEYRDVRNSAHMIRQQVLFRDHGLGNFRTLLHAIAKDPAMLEYLDNNKNRKGAPNENFAREVMELFTLGQGNYTEKDIKEAARAFTGWTFSREGFLFRRRQHDRGTKTVLGKKGRFTGTQVLDILLDQPSASQHLARKLLTYFMGTDPSATMVRSYAAELRKHDWEIAPVLKRLMLDRAFYSPDVVASRILGPVELLVGTCRRLGECPPGAYLVAASANLGQDLLQPPNVKGWDGGVSWITTSSYLQRGNLASYIVSGITREQLRRDFAPEPEDAAEEGMMDMGSNRNPKSKAKAKGPAMAKMSDISREMRQLLRATFEPSIRLTDLVSKANTVDEVVTILCDHLLAVPVTEASKASLVRYLEEKVIEDSTETYSRPSEHRLKRLARLILSLPEANLG